MSDSTDPPAPQPWQRKHRPEPEPPAADKSSAGGGNWGLLKALLSGLATIGLIVASLGGSFCNSQTETPDPGSPAALSSPDAVEARSRSLKRLGDQLQATVVLNETDAHLTRIEAAVEKLRAILDRPGPGLGPAEYEQVTETTTRSLDTLQERLTLLLKSDLRADQSDAARRHLERIELVRCILVGMAPKE